MKTPTDNPRRPSRPTRRFSAMQPAIRRRGEAEEADAGTEEAAAPDALDVPDTSELPAGDEAVAALLSSAGPAPVVADGGAAEPEAPVTPAMPAEKVKPKRTKTPSLTAVAPPSGEAAAEKGDEARVAKVMSRAGLCSRRDAEAWILAGRVAVNGTVIESPALNVGPADQVTVDGYPIEKPEHTRLFMFHKTRGLVTTARDPEGRATIYAALPDDLPRLMTVGRLDINTEGLLLLTNDGGLARLLELPATGWLRRYRVRANGRVDQSQLDALAKGVTVEGIDYAGIDAKLDRIQGANLWLTIGLREGKNREVKRVLEHLGLAVTRLIRISFGPFQLGDLAENAVEEVRTRILKDQLGTALAKQAGLDFGPAEPDMPREAPAAAPEPRRKTSRSATADRKGRKVPVERITSVGKPASRPAVERSGPRKPPRAAAGFRDDDGRPARGAARAERGESRTPDRSEGRPARTLRQADAGFRRADAAPRSGTREGRDTAGKGAPRRESRGAGEGRERPAFRGTRSGEERGGDARRENASRPRTGRVDDRSSRDTRGGEGRGSEPKRSFGPRAGKGAGGEGAPPRRPGGKPPFKGSGGRPDGGKPQRPGGGGGGSGRGRPRG